MTTEQHTASKNFNIIFAIVSAIVFIIAGIRSAVLPFFHDEVATFFFYIQPNDFLPFKAHVDANNHFLNSFLARICFDLFGSSPFSLRIPNLLALLVLIVACHRLSRQLRNNYSKFVLLAGFLLSFHWLSFFSACRGYGLSMAFLVLAIAFLVEYIQAKEWKKLLIGYVCLQLAISANLILIIVTLVLTAAIVLFQLLNKILIVRKNIILLVIHIALLLFWYKYSLFLQANNALYYGQGESYWKVTFLSLIRLLTGTSREWVAYVIALAFFTLVLFALIINFKKLKEGFLNIFSPGLFYSLLTLGFIIIFYLMKVLMNINYPEDRTGLFFYAFAVIGLVFTIDQLNTKSAKFVSYSITGLAILHFCYFINFNKHSLVEYNTIPERFYDKLLAEQQANPEPITIGGHRLTELMYNFMNYRHGGALNLIDPPEEMHMTCDYAIAWKEQKNYYTPYYNTIDTDNVCGYTLLKRKQHVNRILIRSDNAIKPISGSGEYFNVYELKDTAFSSNSTLLLEVNIASVHAEMPLLAWFVLGIDSAEGQSICYKRIPMNWLTYDWTGTKNKKLCMVSNMLPKKIHRLLCYVWNMEKKPINIDINSIKVFRLEGDGLNVTAPMPELNW